MRYVPLLVLLSFLVLCSQMTFREMEGERREVCRDFSCFFFRSNCFLSPRCMDPDRIVRVGFTSRWERVELDLFEWRESSVGEGRRRATKRPKEIDVCVGFEFGVGVLVRKCSFPLSQVQVNATRKKPEGKLRLGGPGWNYSDRGKRMRLSNGKNCS